MKKLIAISHVVVIFLFGNFLGYSQISQESGDLKNEIISISSNMPGSGSEGYVKPSLADLNNWRDIISRMLEGEYLSADSLIQDNFPYYELILFTDTSFENKEYYLQQLKKFRSLE